MNGRRGIEFAVENDSQLPGETFLDFVGQVLRSEHGEQFPPDRIEHEVHAPVAAAIGARTRPDQVFAGHVEVVFDDEDFRNGPFADFLGPRGNFGVVEFLFPALVDRDPPGAPLSLGVLDRFRVLAERLVDQGTVVFLVGQDTEFEGSCGADDVFQLPGFGFADVGDNDLDLFDAAFADGYFLMSARVYPFADGADELLHLLRGERFVARFLRLVDFVDEYYSAAEVDAEFRRPPENDNHDPAGQCAEHQPDLPPVVGHADLLRQVSAEDKRYGQQGQYDQQYHLPRQGLLRGLTGSRSGSCNH